MPEADPFLIELKISHYRAVLKLHLSAVKRSSVEQLLGEARRDLVRAKQLQKQRADHIESNLHLSVGDPPVGEPPRTRICLSCDQDFPSQWAGERICPPCKQSAAWRAGLSYKSAKLRSRVS
jgi:hypothetical protein